MSLIFFDGFDHYTTILSKWRNYGNSGGLSMVPSSGRYGGAAYAYNMYRLANPAEEHATFICGAAAKVINTPNAGSYGGLLTLLSDNGTTKHVTLRIDSVGRLSVTRGAYNGTQLGAESGTTFATASWRYVEMKVTLSATVGTVEVRVDGSATPVIALSNANTKNGGTKTVFDSYGYCDGSSFALPTFYIDDFYAANAAGTTGNDFLGDCRVETLFPTGDGANVGFTPSTGTVHAATVDETAPNTTDYVSSSVADTKDTYVYANMATLNGTVYGVQSNIYAQKSSTGSRSVAPVYRHAGADYDGTDQAVGQAVFDYYRELRTQNPGTGTAWTVPDVNNAEFGVKVRP